MVTSWYRIWYRTTQAIFVLLFAGFSVVIPLDCIVQASDSKNTAVNTFIIVGAIVVFVVFVISISIARILIFKRSLQDIPKRYIPITTQDMPHRESREYVTENMNKVAKLSELFQKPARPVFHAGMEPMGTDEFPGLLKYSEIVKFIADSFRFDGAILGAATIDSTPRLTFADGLKRHFENEKRPYKKYLDELIALYDCFRFSGEDIDRTKFIKFLNLYSILYDLSTTFDNRIMESSSSPFLKVTTDDEYDYDTDNRSQSESEMSDGYLRPYPSDNFIRHTLSSSHMGFRNELNSDPDEAEEPPESIDDYNRYHDMLSKVESYNTVIHR